LRLPREGRRIREWPTDEHQTCSQGEGVQYVGSSSDSAVEHYFDIRAGVYHVGKHIQRRYGAIELASPVIGNDDPVSAGISCGACIGRVDYAFHYQRAAPLTTDLREVLPVEVAPVGKVALHVRRYRRIDSDDQRTEPCGRYTRNQRNGRGRCARAAGSKSSNDRISSSMMTGRDFVRSGPRIQRLLKTLRGVSVLSHERACVARLLP